VKNPPAQVRPGEEETVLVELSQAVSLHLTLVKPGRFLMGSNDENASDNEKPAHEVYFTEHFYIGTSLVTQAQWEAVFPDHNPSYFKGTELPVEKVSWHDIVDGTRKGGPPEAFLTRINRQLAKDPKWTGYAFRLPTEAEWEYAAKGGHLAPQDFDQDTATKDLYPEYGGSDELDKAGWYGEKSNNSTHPVGRKQANELGLYDLSGNVWEWCADEYDGNIYRKRAGEAPLQSPVVKATENRPFRVLRGGSWVFPARRCRLSDRSYDGPGRRVDSRGFRLVLAPVRASE
jgi:formylglycine-generating enzyme required for sulfatase activity